MIPPPADQGGANGRDIAGAAYVYLLKSVKDGRSYLGWTTELGRRLEEHHSGAPGYATSRGPWVLVGYEVYASPDAAKRRERALKRSPRMRALFKKRVSAGGARTAVGGPRQVVG